MQRQVDHSVRATLASIGDAMPQCGGTRPAPVLLVIFLPTVLWGITGDRSKIGVLVCAERDPGALSPLALLAERLPPSQGIEVISPAFRV
jgi:hypothetical protein